MQRHSSLSALALASRAAWGDNRSVTFLSAERGVFDAMLFGGQKSHLRALVSPWHTGTLWLYENAQADSLRSSKRHSPKISDFDATLFRTGIRDSLYKIWAAWLASELAICTNASGEYGACWTLVNAFLDGIDAASEAESRTALLRFLWRYLDLLGVRPNPDLCARCGGEMPPGGARYCSQENGFICGACGREDGGEEERFPLADESRAYLSAVSALPPKDSRRLALSAEAAGELRRCLFYLTERACGRKLKTLEGGIL